ncbi:hypothetical protein AVEN_81374-1 [Araneus ventricosus]|uniref:Mos1 transposase HTH domain-containing protein n=1 Tax=Araneus ventricosus TaxID=182803 RepID=A0A4Y2B7L2_ARAVE|nr:hypothetical protein AVEN_81374-1 [Araneus ventricosus]
MMNQFDALFFSPCALNAPRLAGKSRGCPGAVLWTSSGTRCSCDTRDSNGITLGTRLDGQRLNEARGDQPSLIKIEVARGKNASEYYHGLREACGVNALPYRKVTLWVKAFRVGLNETADLHRTGRPSIPQHQADIVSGLLSIDRRWTVRELSVKFVSSSKGVAYIEEMANVRALRCCHRQTPC